MRQLTASGLVVHGVHLNRFFSPASAGLFLLPFLKNSRNDLISSKTVKNSKKHEKKPTLVLTYGFK